MPFCGRMAPAAASASSTTTAFDSASFVTTKFGLAGLADTPSYTSGERPSTVTAILKLPSSAPSASASLTSTLTGFAFGEAFFAVKT